MAEHFAFELTPSNAEIYRRALADLTDEELEHGCVEALKTCKFMPKVADIRQHVKKTQELEKKDDCDREWRQVLDRIWAWDEYYNTWGSAGPPQLSEAGHQAVRNIGGYTAIQRTAPEHLPLLKKTWDEVYQRKLEYTERFGLGDGESRKLLNDIRKVKNLTQ